MKRRFLNLLIFLSSFFVFTNVYALNGYEITSYDIDIVVNENNSFDITEKITTNFEEYKHGIIRKIPLKNKISRLDGTTSRNTAKISNIEVNNKYSKSKSDGNLNIKIGDANQTIIGKKEYTIKYNYKLSKDKEKDFDELYFNIIGNDWDTTISNVTFTIHMPKDFDESKLGFSYGKYGSTDNELIYYEVDDNIITGKLYDKLNPYEGLTVRCELEEGYFKISLLEQIIDNIIFIFPVICLLISLFLMITKGIDRHVVETVEFYPPEGLNSLDVAYLYNGEVNDKNVISLLIYLANKGYIKIIEDEKKNVRLKKLKDYDGTDECEELFLEGLFKNGDEVKPSSLRNKFYKTISNIKKAKVTNNLKNSVFERKNNKYRIIIIVSIVLSIFIPLGLSVYESSDISGLIITVFLLCFYSIFFIVGFAIKEPKMFRVFWLGFTTVHFLVMAGGFIVPFLDNKLIILVEIICLIGMLICLKYIPKRTDYGIEMLGKIRGFRRFLITAEKEKLESMVSANPSYFYDILPFAYVLGVSDKWIKQFEEISVVEPDWYGGSSFDSHSINHFMHDTMSTISHSMTSMPSSSGSSSGGSSHSSGGGSSGGGSGGGGGSSW